MKLVERHITKHGGKVLTQAKAEGLEKNSDGTVTVTVTANVPVTVSARFESSGPERHRPS